MAEITYRNATTTDAVLLERLFRTSFSDTFAHLYRPEDLEAFLSERGVDSWKEELADPRFSFRIAEEDGVAAGYVKIGPIWTPVEPPRPAIELRQLYILPRWKGRGIGKALIDWALAQAKADGAEEVYLSVYNDNPRARSLYESFGFEEIGSYQFMVGSHVDDERIMRLRLV